MDERGSALSSGCPVINSCISISTIFAQPHTHPSYRSSINQRICITKIKIDRTFNQYGPSAVSCRNELDLLCRLPRMDLLLYAMGKWRRNSMLGRPIIKLMFAWNHVCKPFFILIGSCAPGLLAKYLLIWLLDPSVAQTRPA